MTAVRTTCNGLLQHVNSSIDTAWFRKALRPTRRPRVVAATRWRAQRPPAGSWRQCFSTTTGRSQQHDITVTSSTESFDEFTSQIRGTKAPATQRRPSLKRPTRTPSLLASNSAWDIDPPLPQDTKQVSLPPDLTARIPQARQSELTALLKNGYRHIQYCSDSTLYEAIRLVRDREKHQWQTLTRGCIERLIQIQEQGEPVDEALLYETMLMAHAKPQGSGDAVRALMAEMHSKNISWTLTTYKAALAALAVHPDYLARNMLLENMKERWVNLDAEAHAYVAIGLLRDGQLELALEKLGEMITDRTEIASWVYDTFIFVLAELEHLDDALRIVQHRLDRHAGDVTVNTWAYLLDMCSRAQHIEGAKYVWKRTVPSRILVPSDGVATAVLNAATRHGDTAFATDVIEYLASQGARLRLHHFEALSEAYAAKNEVTQAIQVLTMVEAAGVRPTAASTSGISQCLERNPALAETAAQTLREIIQERRSVPICLFNAIMGHFLSVGQFDQAMNMYRRIRDYSSQDPDSHTYRRLLRHCSRVDIATFLDAEMRAFGVPLTWHMSKEHFRIHLQSPVEDSLAAAKGFFGKLQTAVKQGEIHESSLDYAEIIKAVPVLLQQMARAQDRQLEGFVEAAVVGMGLDQSVVDGVLTMGRG